MVTGQSQQSRDWIAQRSDSWVTFAGSRMLRALLVQDGFKVGRLHVATLMKRMGIEAPYRRPNTSKPTPGHETYPCLLRKLAINCPNQVWALDIIYIPMARGFIYLAAVRDWCTRRVLAWRVSITLAADARCASTENHLLRRSGPARAFGQRHADRFGAGMGIAGDRGAGCAGRRHEARRTPHPRRPYPRSPPLTSCRSELIFLAMRDPDLLFEAVHALRRSSKVEQADQNVAVGDDDVVVRNPMRDDRSLGRVLKPAAMPIGLFALRHLQGPYHRMIAIMGRQRRSHNMRMSTVLAERLT